MKLNRMGWFLSKIKQKIVTHNHETICEFYRSCGVKVGKNSIICDYISIGEPGLVEIKNDCVISSEVSFVTHDHSINKVTDKGSQICLVELLLEITVL